jgi:hypothetical protein
LDPVRAQNCPDCKSLAGPGRARLRDQENGCAQASYHLIFHVDCRVARSRQIDKIALMAKDGGCAMKATFILEGPDDSDWRQFHHRLERSLAKVQAAKPKPAATSTGQE